MPTLESMRGTTAIDHKLAAGDEFGFLDHAPSDIVGFAHMAERMQFSYLDTRRFDVGSTATA